MAIILCYCVYCLIKADIYDSKSRRKHIESLIESRDKGWKMYGDLYKKENDFLRPKIDRLVCMAHVLGCDSEILEIIWRDYNDDSFEKIDSWIESRGKTYKDVSNNVHDIIMEGYRKRERDKYAAMEVNFLSERLLCTLGAVNFSIFED